MLSAAIVGISALGRETNLLGLLAQPLPRERAAWFRAALSCVIAVIPILIWYDYLRSIYRSTTLVGTNQLVWPGSGLAEPWSRSVEQAAANGLLSPHALSFWILFSLAVQALYLFVRRPWTQPWWRVALGYAVLMLMLERVLADPVTGAITRVLLPMTVGVNVLLAREPRTTPVWFWFVAANLHVIAALRVMPLIPW